VLRYQFKKRLKNSNSISVERKMFNCILFISVCFCLFIYFILFFFRFFLVRVWFGALEFLVLHFLLPISGLVFLRLSVSCIRVTSKTRKMVKTYYFLLLFAAPPDTLICNHNPNILDHFSPFQIIKNRMLADFYILRR